MFALFVHLILFAPIVPFVSFINPIQRVRKFFLVFGGILLGLLLIVVIGLKLFLTDERLRAMIEPALESQLNREVSIGTFETRLLRSFPNISVGAAEVAIHTPDAASGERPDLARVERIWVDLSLFLLLQSKIQINALEIENPLILVEVYDDLSTNLIELNSEAGAQEEAASESVVQEISIERFIISEGQIAYSHADGTLLTITSLDTDLSIRLDELASITGRIDASDVYYETGNIPYANGWEMALEVDALANLDSSWVRLAETSFSVESLLLQLQGQVSDWDTDRIGFDLNIASPGATIEGIWSLMPASLKKDIEGLDGTGDVDVTASITGYMTEDTLPDTDAAITVQDGSLKYPGMPAAIEDINLDAIFSLDALKINTLTANAAGASMQISGDVRDYAAPVINADVKLDADLGRIQSFYPLEEGTSLSGTLALDSKIAGALNDTDAIEASGEAVLSNINYASASLEQPVRGVAGTLQLLKNQIRIEGLTFISGQSDFLFNGTLDNYMAFLSDEDTSADKPAFRGAIESEYLNVTEQLSDDTTDTGPLELPDLFAELTFKAATLDYDGIVLKNADGKMTMDQGIIVFEGGSAGFMDGLLRASGSFNLVNPLQPVFDGTIGLDQVKASQFFTAFDQLDQIAKLGTFLDGFFDSEASIGLQMDQALNPVLSSLFAEGTFGASGGALKGMPVQEKLAGLTGLSALEALSIGQWSHKFNISGEKLNVQSLKLNAGAYDFTINGSQGFDGSLDYILRVEMPESAADAMANAPIQASLGAVSQLANVALVDPQTKRITLDFLAGGTFLEPQLSLDGEMLKSRLNARASALADGARAEAQARLDSLENAARVKAEAELAEQKRLLEEKAKDEANKLLEGVIGDSTGMATNIDSLKEKGGEVLKDRLKGLLNRKKKKN
ncbi:MAG: AsmA-like C-terminal region-containing protein [Rhodothermales bacterium]